MFAMTYGNYCLIQHGFLFSFNINLRAKNRIKLTAFQEVKMFGGIFFV